ncbi:hypothetical protein MHYP_G00242900 [Metynnis hypsauchen]
MTSRKHGTLGILNKFFVPGGKRSTSARGGQLTWNEVHNIKSEAAKKRHSEGIEHKALLPIAKTFAFT